MRKIKIKVIICFIIFFAGFLISTGKTNHSYATGEDCCDSITGLDCLKCKACPDPTEQCVRNGLADYQCQPAKQTGFDCDPWGDLLPGCGECAKGLKCKRGGFGAYICTPEDENPDSWSCNPWTGDPCKSKGETCKRVSWNHYECSTGYSIKKICLNMPASCVSCMEEGRTWTALGCLPTENLNSFLAWTVEKFVFIASGIAFLLMAFGAFQIITSSGDPKKSQAGSEVITSALSGLLFIILSVFLLKLIGVDILRIPGFGS